MKKTFREFCPEWAKMSDHVRELSTRKEEIFRELFPLTQGLSNKGQNSFQRPIPPLPPSPHPAVVGLMDRKSKKIRDALGPYVDQLPAPAAIESDIDKIYHLNGDQRRATELAQEAEAIDHALEILRPQVDKLRAQASADFCAQVQDEYKSIAGRVCAAIIEVGRAMEDHRRFVKGITEQGAAYSSLRTLNVDLHYGSPSDRYSDLRLFLDDAIYLGHLDAKAIPQEWPKQ